MMRKRYNFRYESQASHTSMHPPELNEKQDALSSIGTHTNISCADDIDTAPLESVAAPSHVGSGTPSAFKFSVSRLPHWAQAMVSQTSAEKKENNLEDCSLYSSDSRWAERLGAEGYKLFCEPEVLIPPATVLPNNFGHRRRLTIEPSASSAYSTPESSLGSQLSGTSSTSPIVSGRKHNYWKTVHTLFFDEECTEDDVFSDSRLLLPPGKDEEHQNVNHPHVSKVHGEQENISKDDSTVLYLSDSEQQATMSMISMLSKNKCDDRFNSEQELSTSHFQTPAPLACMLNHRSEKTESVLVRSTLSPTQNCRLDFTKKTQHFPGSPNENVPQSEDQLVGPTADDISDEDESDLPFCPNSNIFNSHFGNLSTAIKVQAGKASARSSFSTRFFAQASHPLPVLSLFQDSPQSESTQDDDTNSSSNEGRISTCILLAEEREILKLKEQQNNICSGISPTQISSGLLMINPDIEELHQDNIHHGISTTQISSGFQSLLMINPEAEELQAVGKPQPVSSTVKEQSASMFFGSLSVESEGDNAQYCSHSSTMDCAVLANNPPVKSHLLSSSMDNKLLTLESNLQEEVLSIPYNQSTKNKIDAMDLESPPPGEDKIVAVDEGRVGHVSLIGECKNRCSDITTAGLGDMIVDSLKPDESLNDLRKALQDLTNALDRAVASFRGLNLTNETDSAMVANLSSLHEEYIPPALQKVWLLSDSMTALHQQTHETSSACDHPPILEFSRTSYSEHGSLRLSNAGVSRPCTAASAAPTSSAFESIDIEGFIHDYSVRFSTTLASQVLALVQKGLAGQHEK